MLNLSADIATASSSGILALAVFGFSGSLHCAGMCGPLAASTSRRGKARDVLAYHAARTITYGIIGFALGLLASVFFDQFPKLQAIHGRYLAFILGFVMLAYAVVEGAFKLGLVRFRRPMPLLRLITRRVSLNEPIVLGIVTALLPCGFLYAAFLQSTLLAHPVYSGLGMVIFAVATGPALGLGGAVLLWFQKRFPKVAPWISTLALVVAAVAIIMRGLPHHH